MSIEPFDCPNCNTKGVYPMPGHICPNCKRPLSLNQDNAADSSIYETIKSGKSQVTISNHEKSQCNESITELSQSGENHCDTISEQSTSTNNKGDNTSQSEDSDTDAQKTIIKSNENYVSRSFNLRGIDTAIVFALMLSWLIGFAMLHNPLNFLYTNLANVSPTGRDIREFRRISHYDEMGQAVLGKPYVVELTPNDIIQLTGPWTWRFFQCGVSGNHITKFSSDLMDVGFSKSISHGGVFN